MQRLVRTRAAVVIAAALMLAGCNTDRIAAPAPSGPTVAFESIDGPPPAVFNRLVDNLGAEAAARRIAVVSREAQATYRVRGYLAAHVDRDQVQIGWVWDVYDAEKRRAFRISGEEGGAARRPAEAWAAADEAMLRRIAQTSMERLTGFLASPQAPSETSEPPPPSVAAAAPETPSGRALAALR